MKPVKLLDKPKGHLSNEQRAEREDAKRELFNHAALTTISPPDWFPASAKSEWDRLLPVLKNDFPLSETDYGMLVSYFLAFSRIKTAEGEIRKYGTYIKDETSGKKNVNPAVRVQSQAMKDLKQAAAALGMTLEVRSKLAMVKAKESEPTDPFRELMDS